MLFNQPARCLAAGLIAHVGATAVSYEVPAHVPSTAARLDPTPIGASFEFFMWPSYMTNITPPLQCMDHFTQMYGQKMPVRIGGTTQDRATYDPNLEGYVSYHVDDALDAPMTLTYGPSFFDLIAEFGAETTIGLNRGDDNITNTLEAALMAKAKAGDYIAAVELGNEPDLYYMVWGKPVAVAPWNNSQEGTNAAEWAQAFINAWEEPLPILSGGGYAVPIPLQPNWPDTNYPINEAYNETIKAATKEYNTHLYALSNETRLSVEMNHVKTVADLSNFVNKIATTKSIGRPYIIGETGFHGLDKEMDSTLGGALQVLDKTLWALSLGIKKLFYHQGTINQAFFNWWSDNQVNAPFYGGFLAALAVSGGDDIIASDAGEDSSAQYVIFKNGAPIKVVLINTDYYSGTGTRSSTKFTLTSLAGPNVKAIRMTAPSSEATTAKGEKGRDNEFTIAGQYFSNCDCTLRNPRQFERASVKDGEVTFELAASEALLVYL